MSSTPRKPLLIIAICLLFAFVLVSVNLGPSGSDTTYSDSDYSPKETCFLSGEKVSGMNRICYYDCASGEAAISIDALELCPLSMKRLTFLFPPSI